MPRVLPVLALLLALLLAGALAVPGPARAGDMPGAGSVNTSQVLEGVAIEGYDPVAYFTDGKPEMGDPAITLEWNGAIWRFATPDHRDLFAAQPEHYAPQYGGFCALAVSKGYTATVDPRAFRIIDGKLYLAYSLRALEQWEKNLPDSTEAGRRNWQGD
ncbi:YHS domain-containing (seleno)protein [Roseospirillum parvum]|uniref:YHS domain-containing protein n=1 Tax=Roseospirillum parvum TaxID=83401 RepID=A0A1G8FPS3_9PROT|nr:YHS domain-containing (seleno)protein [Roseospirillum parvum]SDH84099.1 hypothetical protein SAMN05421742_11530 [Roseospirillum parvum]